MTQVTNIEHWDDIDEVRVYRAGATVVGTITKLDGQLEFHFPTTGVMFSKEQAALVAAHLIVMSTQK